MKVFNSIAKSYKKYGLFFQGKKLNNLAILDSLIFVIRRLIFVASAIFLVNGSMSLLAISIFMILSYLQVLFVISVQPHTKKFMQWTEAINELFILLFGYIVFSLANPARSREEIL